MSNEERANEVVGPGCARERDRLANASPCGDSTAGAGSLLASVAEDRIPVRCEKRGHEPRRGVRIDDSLSPRTQRGRAAAESESE